MRAVVQRVKWARVSVKQEVVGQIDQGLCVLVGAGTDDTLEDVDFLVNKVIHLRIFEDDQHHMNRSLLDMGGAMLVVSQFTLYGDCRKGRRPSFVGAMPPEPAKILLNEFVARSRAHGVKVETGRFQAMMDVELCNHGPVTMLLDSRKLF